MGAGELDLIRSEAELEEEFSTFSDAGALDGQVLAVKGVWLGLCGGGADFKVRADD
jgi:hypothetical protein